MWAKYDSTTFVFSNNLLGASETNYKKACCHYRDYLLRHPSTLNTPRDDNIVKELEQRLNSPTTMATLVHLEDELFKTHPEHWDNDRFEKWLEGQFNNNFNKPSRHQSATKHYIDYLSRRKHNQTGNGNDSQTIKENDKELQFDSLDEKKLVEKFSFTYNNE